MKRKVIGILALTLTAVTTAYASAVPTPEIDPATAMSGLTLLLGGLAVVRGRIKKKKQD
jgi:hypothetical protein